MSSTILVTGAAGFIGSNLVDALLDRGHVVVGLDSLDAYYDPARKEANLRELAAHPAGSAFRFVRGDIRDRPLVGGLFAEHRFDAVCHLAAMAGVRASVEEPHLYYDVDLVGTLGLLEAARAHGRPNFVFASTSSVYGASQRQPFVEDDPADRPLAPYPAAKRGAELLGHAYHHLHGLDFTALRFFTVYGPRGRPDMMAYKLVQAMDTGVPIPLYDGGRLSRDWTFVSDIVQGVVAATERRLGYEVVNLGRGESVLVSDFIVQLERHTGRAAPVEVAPRMAADVEATLADISKARRLLGYDPKVSVAEGTARFLEWYRRAVSSG